MKDLVKEEKQTCMILYLEFGLKRRLDTSLTWSIIISILIAKWLAIKGNKKLIQLKKDTIHNDFNFMKNLIVLACYKQSLRLHVERIPKITYLFFLFHLSKLLTNRGQSRCGYTQSLHTIEEFLCFKSSSTGTLFNMSSVYNII